MLLEVALSITNDSSRCTCFFDSVTPQVLNQLKLKHKHSFYNSVSAYWAFLVQSAKEITQLNVWQIIDMLKFQLYHFKVLSYALRKHLSLQSVPLCSSYSLGMFVFNAVRCITICTRSFNSEMHFILAWMRVVIPSIYASHVDVAFPEVCLVILFALVFDVKCSWRRNN